MVAYKFEKELLIKVGAASLQHKRIIHPTLNSENSKIQ